VDRWHLASRELVSGRVEKLVLKVARREYTKWRSGERDVGAVHLREDRWTGDLRISRTRELAG
jgi:hypothetical protein